MRTTNRTDLTTDGRKDPTSIKSTDAQESSPSSDQTGANAVGSSSDNGLTADQQQRLSDLLDQYLVALEQGEDFDVRSAIENNLDIAETFESYLRKLDQLYGVALADGVKRADAASQAPANPESLKRLGDFELGKIIGRGGMGIVYEATQEGLDRRVAVKLLPLSSTLDSIQVARFKNEARAAGLLSHPHIVPVYSIGSDQGLYYYVMQLIDGVSLGSWVRGQVESAHVQTDSGRSGSSRTDASESPVSPRTNQPDVDWQHIVGWASDTAKALHEAHVNGVIHRDIKPSNLILDRQGKIWVTDFGLARGLADLSLTGSGDMLGTIRYMSPEQASGKSALVDGRCDVYSLAVTLYELLTLQPAFDADTATEVIRQIDNQTSTPLLKLRPDLPRDLATVISKGMEKHRDARYETAAEFAEDLQNVLHGRPTVARPPSFIDHVSLFTARYRSAALVLVSFMVLATLGLSIATVTFADLKVKAENSADHAQRKQRMAREAVDSLALVTAERLAGIPAASDVRKQLLKDTLQFYQGFISTPEDDSFLRTDMALALGKMGLLERELGNDNAALEHLHRSEKMLQELLQADPANETMQLNWSVNQDNLGEIYARRGQYERATEYYAKALDTQQRLNQQSDDSEIRRCLATTLNNLGLLQTQRGDQTKAFERFQEALSALGEDSDVGLEIRILRNLSTLHQMRDPASAVEDAKRAQAIHRVLRNEKADDLDVLNDYVVTLNHVAAAQYNAGQFNHAIDTDLDAVDLAHELIGRQTDRPDYLRTLVATMNHLALSRASLGDKRHATNDFLAALRRARELAEVAPEHPESYSILADTLSNVGKIYDAQDKFLKADPYYVEAAEVIQKAVEKSPEVKRYQQEHAYHLAKLDEQWFDKTSENWPPKQATQPRRSLERSFGPGGPRFDFGPRSEFGPGRGFPPIGDVGPGNEPGPPPGKFNSDRPGSKPSFKRPRDRGGPNRPGPNSRGPDARGPEGRGPQGRGPDGRAPPRPGLGSIGPGGMVPPGMFPSGRGRTNAGPNRPASDGRGPARIGPIRSGLALQPDSSASESSPVAPTATTD